MATYSDKYLFEFETRKAEATATQLGRIATQAKAASVAIRELAGAYAALAAVSNVKLPDLSEVTKRISIVNANQVAGDVNVNSIIDSQINKGGGGGSGGSSSGTRSTYLRDTTTRIADYTKFWLIGWGINQAVQLISKGIDDWASAQQALNQIIAEFEVSLNISGDAAKAYAEDVLAISRATGISMREIGPGYVIQQRVAGAPKDLTLRAAQVQRITGADNYSVERDLLSLTKQFPDKSIVQILDAFTGAMRRSSLTAAEFFDLLESSGPIARQFNTSMEAVFGVSAGLSTATGESGPAIELFIRQMERVYTDAGTRSTVEKYVGPVSWMNPQTGYEVRRPWDEIMTDISKLSQDAQNEIALTIPNMLGQQTRQLFLALMKDWQGGVTDAMNGAKNAEGEFERSFNVMSETWITKTQAMSTAWESFLATIQGSENVLKLLDAGTQWFNRAAVANLANPKIEKYNQIRERESIFLNRDAIIDPSKVDDAVRFKNRFLSAEELFERETGKKAEVPFKDRPFLSGLADELGNPFTDFHVPEFYEWAAKNIDKYAAQASGKEDQWTDWQKKGLGIELARGQIGIADFWRMTQTIPEGWNGPLPPGVGRQRAGGWINPFQGGGVQAQEGMIPMYLEDQRLTLKKGITPDKLVSEMAKIQAEIVKGYREMPYQDATGKTVRPYEKMTDKEILDRAGMGTQSPLLAFDETGKPLQAFTGNIGIANLALDALSNSAKGAADAVKTGITTKDWYGGKSAYVMAEYNKLVAGEVSQRRSDPKFAGMDDDAIKQAIGIQEEYTNVVSSTGTVLATVAVDAEVFATAVANVGKAMAGLEYFEQPDWMGEGDYVRRLNQYSQSNLAVQQREDRMQADPSWFRYVGPSGKGYDVFGNQESLAQATRGVSRDDRRYNDGLAAQKQGNATLEKIHNALQSMVGQLLQPTQVTQGDMAAAKLGKYENKWDEPVRRVRDVVSRREGMNPNLGPWKNFAAEMGIDLSSIESTQMTGAEFERKFYNGLLDPGFYDKYSKEGFLQSARQMMEEKQGQDRLTNQAMGWLKEAGIEGDMAKYIARDLSGDMSPIEQYFRGGKSDAEIGKDLGGLAKTSVDQGMTPGYKAALDEAKPVQIFVDSFGMDKKESRDLIYNLGKSVGSTMVGGISDSIASAILPQVEEKVVAKILEKLGGGDR